MRRKNSTVAKVIIYGTVLLLLYLFYATFLLENKTSTGNVGRKVYLNYSDETNVEEASHSYPYLTRCSMWNSQPPPARLPRWIRQYNPSCQRYGYIPFSQINGFGQNVDNYMNGLIFTSAMNLTYVMTDNFETSSNHLSMSGIIEKLGLGRYSPTLSSLGCAQESVSYNNTTKNYENIIMQAKSLNKCNTCYRVAQFFADDYSPVRWHMAHMVQSRLASTRTTNITYDREKFNIAVSLIYELSDAHKSDDESEKHNSNSSSIIQMIKNFTAELEQIGVPYALHFFTDDVVDANVTSAFPGSVVHSKEMLVADTIQYFIESDLLFCLESSMCRAASIMSTRPFVVNVFPTAESHFYNPCPRGLFCGLLDRAKGPNLSLIKRIREAGEKWIISHKLNCPVETEAWLVEDTSIAVNGPEQCDIWGPPLPPRMLFDPYPDPDCPRYGYIPLDKGRSGSFNNVLRWIKGAALSNLMNVTFVFGGEVDALREEVDLGLADGLHRLQFLNKEESTTVDIPLDGVRKYSEALEWLGLIEHKCGTAYKFGNPDINEFVWSHLTLGHAVQKHIADTKWEPSLWNTNYFNLVVDMTGRDTTVSIEWVLQSLDTIINLLNKDKNASLHIIVVENENGDISNSGMKSRFGAYGNTVFVQKPKSISEHVKHLVAVSDIVFCPRIDAEECHIAALAASRPGFIIRGEEDGFNFCPNAGMCSLVLGNEPIAVTGIAFVPGIIERWDVGKYVSCL